MDAAKLMQAWFPQWTDQERHDVLWNCTAYPCGGLEIVTEQQPRLVHRSYQTSLPAS